MRLKEIEFTDSDGEARNWSLGPLSLGDINLIVGRNSSGKSRTLNIIAALGNLFSGDIKVDHMSGCYRAVFSDDDGLVSYELKYRNSVIEKETLTINNKTLLSRHADGKGKISAVQLGKEIEFQVPANDLAVVAKRDLMQHPFLEKLHAWGRLIRHYHFGSYLGKNVFGILDKRSNKDLNLKDETQVIGVFRKGKKDYGEKFINAVKNDMKLIGYELSDIDTGVPSSVRIQIQNSPDGGNETQIPGPVICLLVQEKELKHLTDQHEMSQGMFRALSLLIQLNFSQLASLPSCILIDDIGEGLDFERSSALIKLLIDKAIHSAVQLIMSTNDRFIMNGVPIEYWAIMKRDGSATRVYNIHNSKKAFEQFKYTGLNNFDFFATDFFQTGLDAE